MLTISNLSARVGDRILFENANFTINSGDKTALIGPNGAGKSTLLRMLSGNVVPTSGSISVDPRTTVGYLRQGFADAPEGTLADVLDVASNGIFTAQRALENATAAFSNPNMDVDTVEERFQHATDHFEQLGGYRLLSQVDSYLDRFGLAGIDLSRPVSEMSGGQKTRAGLAMLLATGPDILLLDEPTNHLDQTARDWLQTFLLGYQGAVLMVSHDRTFIDAIVTRVLVIDPLSASVREYAGNYSTYSGIRTHEQQEMEAAWHRQQVTVTRMQRDIRAAEQKSRNIESSTIDFAIRKKAAKIVRPAVIRKRKLEKMLDADTAVERPERTWGLDLHFGGRTTGARHVLTIDQLGLAYEDRILLRDVNASVQLGDRIAITGENGSGKTSLLKAILGELVPFTGTLRLGEGVCIGYLSQEQETLDPQLTVLEQIRLTVAMSDTDIRNELHKFLFGGDDVHKIIANLSYGERTRLMLAVLVLGGADLLLLDEPLNHLDIDARESFEEALSQYQGTLIMVLHDQYAIDRLATEEWRIDDGHLTEVILGEAAL